MNAAVKPLGVYQAIREVMDDLSKVGISKDRKNVQQGFNFRGIDDVYNALSPALAKANLVILPYIVERQVTERETQRGGTLFYVTVVVDYAFVCTKDGSSHVVRSYGEAMDSGDKATNKAMSAAYKYACFQTFCIPTEGDNDADSTTHEVASKKAEKQAKPAVEPFPADASKQATDVMLEALPMAKTIDELRKFAVDNQRVLSQLLEADRSKVRDAYAKHEAKLKETV